MASTTNNHGISRALRENGTLIYADSAHGRVSGRKNRTRKLRRNGWIPLKGSRTHKR